jgi:hypothetical protein
MGTGGLLFRLIALSIFLYTWTVYYYVAFQKPGLPPKFDNRLKYGSCWRFLTIQNFVMAILVNLLLTVGYFFPKGKNYIFSRIVFKLFLVRYLGNVLHFSCSFPCNMIVFFYFWPIFFMYSSKIIKTMRFLSHSRLLFYRTFSSLVIYLEYHIFGNV